MNTFRFLFALLLSISIATIIFYCNQAEYLKPVLSIKPAKNANRLICIILTNEQNFEKRSVTAWNTWAKKCDLTLFACNCSNFEKNKNFTDIPILQLNLTESYQLMDRKVMMSLEMAYKKYNDEKNWFLMVDDDTYVFVDNAHRFIDKQNSSLPQTFGYNFKITLKDGFHSGGGGILFTPESIKRLVGSWKRGICNDSVNFGDIMIGLCSEKSNVTLGNSLDELGRERFHPLSLKSHYKDPPEDWLYTYSSNVPQFGKECCSDESITFHYVSPLEMIEYAKIVDESKLSNYFNKL